MKASDLDESQVSALKDKYVELSSNQVLKRMILQQKSGDESEAKKAILKRAANQLGINVIEEEEANYVELEDLVGFMKILVPAPSSPGSSLGSPLGESASASPTVAEESPTLDPAKLQALRDGLKGMAHMPLDELRKIRIVAGQKGITGFEPEQLRDMLASSISLPTPTPEAAAEISEADTDKIRKEYLEKVRAGESPEEALAGIEAEYADYDIADIKDVIRGHHHPREQVKAVDEIMDEIRKRSKFQNETRTDAESSMLDNAESQSAQENYNRVVSYYGAIDIDAVLEEMEEYLTSKIGGDPANRKKDEYYFSPHAVALRALLDEAPGSSFGNSLHKGLPPGYDKYRKQLAYYWLAASDKNPPKSLEDLSVKEVRTESELEDNRFILVTKVAEIRRAHNDGVYTPEDSKKDDPSCTPGTWGRIAFSVPSNPLTRMPDDPLKAAPAKIESYLMRLIEGKRIPKIGHTEADLDAGEEPGVRRLDIPQKDKTSIAQLLSSVVMAEDIDVPAALLTPDEYTTAEEIEALREKQLAYERLIKELRERVNDIAVQITVDFMHNSQRRVRMVSTSFQGQPRSHEELVAERYAYLDSVREMCKAVIDSMDLVNTKDASPRGSLYQRFQDAVEAPERKKYLAQIISETKEMMVDVHKAHTGEFVVLSGKSEELIRDLSALENSELEQEFSELQQKYKETVDNKNAATQGILDNATARFKSLLAESEIYTPAKVNLSDFSHIAEVADNQREYLDARSSFEERNADLISLYKEEHRKRCISSIDKLLGEDGETEKLVSSIQEKEKELNELIEDCKILISHEDEYDYEIMIRAITEKQAEIKSLIKEVHDRALGIAKLNFIDGEESNYAVVHTIEKIGLGTDLISDLHISEIKSQFSNKHAAVQEYKRAMSNAQITALELAERFSTGIEATIGKIIEKDGEKLTSKSHQQIQALQDTKDKVMKIYGDLSVPESKMTFVSLSKITKDLNNECRDLDSKLSKIGYPSRFSRFMNSIKNGCKRLLNLIPGINLKLTELKTRNFFSSNLNVELKQDKENFDIDNVKEAKIEVDHYHVDDSDDLVGEVLGRRREISSFRKEEETNARIVHPSAAFNKTEAVVLSARAIQAEYPDKGAEIDLDDIASKSMRDGKEVSYEIKSSIKQKLEDSGYTNIKLAEIDRGPSLERQRPC